MKQRVFTHELLFRLCLSRIGLLEIIVEFNAEKFMQNKRNHIKAGATAALLVCAMAGGNATAAQSLNFTAALNTIEFLVPSPLCSSQAAGVGAGTGSSNLFAKKPGGDPVPVGMTSTDCVAPSGGAAVPSNDNPPQLLTFYQGHFIITGPGGDSIIATYGGTLVPVGNQAVPTYQFREPADFVITGGTGRFAKASGRGTITGIEIVNFSTGTSQGQLQASGVINY